MVIQTSSLTFPMYKGDLRTSRLYPICVIQRKCWKLTISKNGEDDCKVVLIDVHVCKKALKGVSIWSNRCLFDKYNKIGLI